MARELAPAVGGDFAVTRVQADDDVPTKRGAGVLQEAGIFDRGRADDDVAQPCIQIALNRVEVADAAAQLHIHFAAHGFENLADRHLVFRMAGKGTVQVDQVQPPGPLVYPGSRHQGRVFAEGGGLIHVALFEAHTLAVF